MTRLPVSLVVFLVSALALAAAGPDLVGTWKYQNSQVEIVAEFTAGGFFHQVTATAQGRQTHSGRYRFDGQNLHMAPDGGLPPVEALCRFADPDTARVTYASGDTLIWRRLALPGAPDSRKPTGPAPPRAAPEGGTGAAGPAGTAPRKPAPVMMMQRTWEPKERAFSFLLPKGWAFEGGVFNVNPLQMNGPGNSITPKCDLALKADPGGRVTLRWAPGWNYADLSLSPSGWGLFRPGMHYQGMPVRPIVGPRPFLLELLKTTRPQAVEVQVVAEDPLPEIAQAYARQAEAVNLNLSRMGLAPTRFEALAMAVEYREGGERFREVLYTTIADARGGAFMWSNDDTLQARAPAAEFDTWKPVLDGIRASRRVNPEWAAAVAKASGERAQSALETQRYIANVANQIVENRRRTHAGIRHENWLLLTGQEEYTNPFNGQTETDTSKYRYRWSNTQGDILYTDENGFDPNRVEEYNTREWKRTPVRPR
jgi:hypothetical protein